ncbi:MAG: polyphosphate kinase 1 [Bryobacteraceae bacterium]|nr:polyphosphate kinase 1 [Bryobacteraceae bacterium]MDW8379569.1 polyphosphate kinase 1 [Bryobacterales bacterium]
MAGKTKAPKKKGQNQSPNEQAISLDDPRLYVNRELSLLEFQQRVLEEAQDETNPLLERVKFLSILGSNLDEFFMVRVAGLKNQLDAGIFETGPDGLSPAQQLELIRARVLRLMDDAHQCRKFLLRELAKHGICVLEYEELSPAQKESVNRYFTDTIYPVLTPLAHDPGRPWPHISNLSLNLSVLIHDKRGHEQFARLKVPDTLPQLIPLQRRTSSASKQISFVWIEQVIQANLEKLFPGMEVVESHPFHVTRDADTAIQEIEAADLLESVEESVRQRRFGAVVRLKVSRGMPARILDILRENLNVDDSDIYQVDGPLALVRLRHLAALDRPELKEPPFVPASLPGHGEEEDIYALIRKGDILLHHPFDSFQPVVDFLRTAARDPNVLAIKMTLYRVGKNSPVVSALLEAMEYGKQVAVLVELKARFDEESNIEWARALEKEGVHVVYGLVGLKIHGKIALVVRREGEVIRRYVHMSTGNYNAVTAHLYTDLGLFTCNEEIGADASDLFNYLTGYSAKADYRKLLVAPINLRERLEGLILREIEYAQKGLPARLIFKINALADPRIIRLLYEASRAGVQVDLIARGICSLRPGVPGVSERIHVRSIVGRFLEHSRIFYFQNGGAEEIYLGSADLMPRNINRRVEILFPIEKPSQIRLIRDRILAVYLADNVKARIMQADGTYVRARREKGEKAINSQAFLLERKKTRN